MSGTHNDGTLQQRQSTGGRDESSRRRDRRRPPTTGVHAVVTPRRSAPFEVDVRDISHRGTCLVPRDGAAAVTDDGPLLVRFYDGEGRQLVAVRARVAHSTHGDNGLVASFGCEFLETARNARLLPEAMPALCAPATQVGFAPNAAEGDAFGLATAETVAAARPQRSRSPTRSVSRRSSGTRPAKPGLEAACRARRQTLRGYAAPAHLLRRSSDVT